MTTYYGVWSASTKEWWHNNTAVFHTTVKGLAMAQARVANAMWQKANWVECWQARAIGEDGLPAKEAIPLAELKAELMQDPAFRAEYEALESAPPAPYLRVGQELAEEKESEKKPRRPTHIACFPEDLKSAQAILDAQDDGS